VSLDGHVEEVTVRSVEGGFEVLAAGATTLIATDWDIGEPLFGATVDGDPFVVQVDREGIGYRLVHAGREVRALVLTPLGARLNALMPEKAPADLSSFLLSPMPGLLVSLAVAVGQEVKAGEELAVVEAMKMENVLRAERDGVIKKLHAAAGDSLAVDQAILEFE
jgi:propionyl-CoA carboxylase alpha chain